MIYFQIIWFIPNAKHKVYNKMNLYEYVLNWFEKMYCRTAAQTLPHIAKQPHTAAIKHCHTPPCVHTATHHRAHCRTRPGALPHKFVHFRAHLGAHRRSLPYVPLHTAAPLDTAAHCRTFRHGAGGIWSKPRSNRRSANRASPYCSVYFTASLYISADVSLVYLYDDIHWYSHNRPQPSWAGLLDTAVPGAQGASIYLHHCSSNIKPCPKQVNKSTILNHSQRSSLPNILVASPLLR
jgi:hypothetical protein